MLQALYYELTSCGYDSWNQLGKSIRYAQALSLDITKERGAAKYFSLDELQQRNSVWLTLYIQDHLKSMFLGRPLMMIERIEEMKITTNNEYYVQIRQQFAKLCTILQDIQLLYKRGKISIAIAQRIISRLKGWNKEYRLIKNMLEEERRRNKFDLLRKYTKLQLLINLSYYYAMILITKPFLSHIVYHKGESKDKYVQDVTIESLSTVCVQSSVASIRTIMTSFYEKGSHLPRSPLVLYCTFTAGIMLLLDAFSSRTADCRFDEIETWAVSNCLQILTRYSTYDIYAKRYLNVLIEMITIVLKGWKGYDNNKKLAEFGVRQGDNDMYELLFPTSGDDIRRQSSERDNDFDYFDLNFDSFFLVQGNELT